MAKLPPGFHFHPTDVELIMYYLKRKIMGKKILFEVISELNIYKFSPSDLPEKCCYKSKDLEWYFFCPSERKYASGFRMNRTTETGFWKITGRVRRVLYDEKFVGSVKTLVFHQGKAPGVQRTDWVIHEYRFEDKDTTDAGFSLEAYVLCKVFKKSGQGPKNGAQYGAPFKEEDWEDNETPAEHNQSSIPSLPLPDNETCSIVTQPYIHEMPVEPNSYGATSVPAMPDNLSCSVITTMVDPGNKYLWHLTEPGPSSAELYSKKMPQEEDDYMIQLFDNFIEDPAILFAGNEDNLVNADAANVNQAYNAPYTTDFSCH